jgi:hypothetical protein
MQQLIAWIDGIPWIVLIIACLTLGLAPFAPPHILEKLQMLIKGKLIRPIDWFDLLLHGTPWVVLMIKAVISVKK